MYFTPFHQLFPELAHGETRSAIVYNHPFLPDGDYGLLESYCDEPGCDCRRVMFNIYKQGNREALAVVAYGWESEEFYAEWYGEDDPDIIKQMQGPVLNPGSPQSELAPALLLLVQEILQDEAYVARLRRHYQLFKQKVNKKAKKPSRPRRRTFRRLGKRRKKRKR